MIDIIWIVVAALICLAFVVAILVKIYIKRTTGWDDSHTCLAGKTIIVTGGNSGIGYVSAKEFAKRGARVILACRSIEKGNEARQKIVEETDNANVVVKQLDLALFASVMKFAEDINATERRVDVLLNNAGIGVFDSSTKDGLQETMQVNYFATVLLTILLLDTLKRSAPSRIINVSSLTASWAIRTDPDQITNYTCPYRNYATSKLLLIAFTQKLAKTLDNSGISVFSLHPGIIATKLYDSAGKFLGWISGFLINVFYKNVVEGAQTQIYLSAAKGVEKYSGRHFHDCKPIGDYWTARNAVKRERIWKNTIQLLDRVTDGGVSKKIKNIEALNDSITISSHI